MLSYQKNKLLSLLAQFKVEFYKIPEHPRNKRYTNYKMYETIDRNLTSIEKKIKRL